MNADIVKKEIKRFDSFLITSHINPEGDSIGSQLALASLLKQLGKKLVILNESPVPHMLRFIHGSDAIARELPADFNFQAVLVVDCPDMTRIGNISQYISHDKVVFNIDHHISNENFGKYNWVDRNVSSVGEMIFELFKAFNLKINYEEALAMYVAIMTDTGSFRYTNTSAKTHGVTAELIETGIQPYDIYGKIYETVTLEDINLLAESLQTLKLTKDGKVAWLWVTKEMLKKTKASLEGTEGIINFARSIDGVEIAILFRETGSEERIKVSFRSKGNVDVNKLASFFEGGGHVTASGCTVFGSMEAVEKKVLEKAQGMT
jgi:phosphoesterase RecJ-like protein